MSLALSIVDLVCAKALAEGAGKINEVEVEVGSLAGVLVEALTFCYEVVVRDTPAAGAELKIVEVQAKGRCRSCQTIFVLESLFAACPACGTYEVEIIQGRDLKVLAIVVNE